MTTNKQNGSNMKRYQIQRSNGNWFADCTWYVMGQPADYADWVQVAEYATRAEAESQIVALTGKTPEQIFHDRLAEISAEVA